MSPSRLVLEFSESYCRVYAWESAKGTHTLKAVVEAPQEKSDKGKEGAPAASTIQANAAAIRQAIRATGVKAHEALAIVPKQWVNLRIVTLPTTDPAEIAEMARFETERYIPFNVERHIVSHHILRVEGLEGTRVILAALDGPPAQEITAIADALGIQLTGLDVTTLALTNVLMQSGLWDSTANPTVAQVDIGRSTTDIAILHGGVPIFARSIALGVDKIFGPTTVEEPLGSSLFARLDEVDLLGSIDEDGPPVAAPATPAAAIVDGGEPSAAASPPISSTGVFASPREWSRRMIQEIRRTWEFAQREFECEPLSRLFVSGAGAQLRGLPQIILSNLGVEAVEVNPFGGELRIETGARDIDRRPLAWVVGAGGLLRDTSEQSLRVNLLPTAYVDRNVTFRRRRTLITMAILAIVFVASAFLFMHELIASRENLLQYYNDQINATKERAKDLQYRKVVVRILKANTSRQGSALAILDTISGWDDLFGEANMRVALSEFDFTAQKSVTLRGEAMTLEDLHNFVAKLEQTKHFRRVKIERQPPKPVPGAAGVGRTIYDYEVHCFFPESVVKSGK